MKHVIDKGGSKSNPWRYVIKSADIIEVVGEYKTQEQAEKERSDRVLGVKDAS